MRGKASDLAVISKFIDSLPCISQPHNANSSAFPILLKIGLFSSMNGNSVNGEFRKYGNYGSNGRTNNDDYDNDGSNFSGNNRGNFSGNKNFRSSRDERGMPQFQGKTNYPNRNFRQQGRNDGFRNPSGGESSKGNMKKDDAFHKFDGIDESSGGVGLGGDSDGRKASQPSVNELLNKPPKREQNSGKKEMEFLEKFKLGGVDDNPESKPDEAASVQLPPQEDKMETPENADEIFKKMKKSGLIPNAVAMLDGLCKDGLVQEAMKLFGLMREKGSMPEVVVYTAVVEGFCQAQQLDDAKRIFRKMQDNGIVPNAFSYTVLIKGLCKGKRLDDAVDFCLEMLENDHSPNVITFTGLVHEFCEEKGVEEARNIILTLKHKGFLLDEKAVRTYLDKNGPRSPMVSEAIFGPRKTAQRTF